LGGSNQTLWTIGHSTRSFEEFLALLEEYRIRLLADVRHFPGSRRVPWTAKVSLARALSDRSIAYEHFEDLGGFRKASHDSTNTAWHNSGFRGYADYMDTPEFSAALDRLIAVSRDRWTAIMCAEAVWWRCHRQLVADALVARGVEVRHISTGRAAPPHELTEFARVVDGKVSYPGLIR